MKLKNPARILVALMSFFLVSYIFYKAIFSSFTHDECYTYSNYVNIPVSDIIFFTNCAPTPNNHVLNSILMKASQAVFGNHEWALRLPNLLAYMLFLVYSLLWLRKLNGNILLVAGFITLHANAYLLDFFSIARGYGLSASFIFVSFYYCWQYFFSLKQQHAWLSFLMASLAVWSNFTGLNYYLSLSCVFFIFLVGRMVSEKNTKAGKLKSFLYRSGPAVIITIFLYLLIRGPLILLSTGSLIGSKDDFYNDTIRSIVFYSFQYDPPGPDAVTKISYFAIGTIVFSACLYLVHLVKKKLDMVKSPNLLLLLIIFFSGLSTVLQYHLLGTPYLQNRTALLFVVLFNVCFILLYQFILIRRQNKIPVHILFCIYPLFLTAMFIYNFRPHFYFDWKYDCDTKEMLTALKKDIEIHPEKNKVTLGITWLYEPAINYYRNRDQLNWLYPVNRDGYAGTFDYYYVFDDPGFIESRKLEVVRKYDDSNSMLMKQAQQQ